MKIFKWFLITIIVFIFMLRFWGSSGENVQLTEKELVIKGVFGGSWEYEDFISAQLIEELPDTKGRTFGKSNSTMLEGHFTFNDDIYEKGYLHIHRNSSPIILLEVKDEKPLFINKGKKDETLDLYNHLNEMIN